jgi:hypothetical protein
MKIHHSSLLLPPLPALKKLEKAACADLTVARLTLGVFGVICGDDHSPLFPGYRWRLSEVTRFPPELVPCAQQLIAWGSNPGIVLNEILFRRIRITNAVHAMRRQSPFARRRIAIANQFRKKFPRLKPEDGGSYSGATPLRSVDILGDEVGRPLSDCTLRLIQGFNPSQVEILASDEGEYLGWRLGGIRIRLQADGYTVASIGFRVGVEPVERPRVVYGFLEDFFETGTEGTIWSVLNDDERGYDALHPIDAGDYLTIQDQRGRKLWSGKIRCDRKSGWQRFPENPKYGQPLALGRWIHWTQRGFKPDDWASYFIRPECDRLRGVLRKKAT